MLKYSLYKGDSHPLTEGSVVRFLEQDTRPPVVYTYEVALGILNLHLYSAVSLLSQGFSTFPERLYELR